MVANDMGRDKRQSVVLLLVCLSVCVTVCQQQNDPFEVYRYRRWEYEKGVADRGGG